MTRIWRWLTGIIRVPLITNESRDADVAASRKAGSDEYRSDDSDEFMAFLNQKQRDVDARANARTLGAWLDEPLSNRFVRSIGEGKNDDKK